MQTANSFDWSTLRKMGISALLLLGGALLSYLADNALKLLGAVGIPKDWLPVSLAVFTWLLNSGKEWLKGEEDPDAV